MFLHSDVFVNDFIQQFHALLCFRVAAAKCQQLIKIYLLFYYPEAFRIYNSEYK